MPTFPFTASWWECECGARWPKRDGLHALVDPYEYLTCLAPGCPRGPGEYAEGSSPEGRSTCYWLWQCADCAGWCSWKDDFCHNPDCGAAWLVDRPPPARIQGKKPTVYENEHEPLSPEEIEEQQEKIKKKQPHAPIPGCPEACQLPHLFALELEAPKLQGCVTEPYAVWAQLDPMLDPAEGPQGSLTWRLRDGAEVATFAGGETTVTGSGLDTEVALEAVAEDGESKFPGGGVTVECVFNFGGPADTDLVARKRFAFHEGVTADCPRACPEITEVEVELKVVDIDLGVRDLTEDTVLCPGETVELAAVLTPEVQGAALTWRLLDAEGSPLPAGAARFDGGLFSDDTSFSGGPGERARIQHGPGKWTGPHTDVPLAGPFGVGGIVLFELEPVHVEVSVQTEHGAVTRRAPLRWHGVQLVTEATWNGPDAPGEVQLRCVRTGGADDGTYVSLQYGHSQHVPSCAGMEAFYAWHGRVTSFEGSALGPCAKLSNCLKGRWGAGFCQAHAKPNRWWKYRAESDGAHAPWFKRVAEFSGPRPLWDAHEGVDRPWYDAPVVLDARTSTADDAPFRAPEGERNSDSPMAFAPWLAQPNAHDYYLRRVTVQDEYQTFLTVGLYDVDQRCWRDFHELATLSWRFDLEADVAMPTTPNDGSTPIRAAALSQGSLAYRAADLLGKPRSNAAESFGEYLCMSEPHDGSPVTQTSPAAQVLDLHLEGGGKMSAGQTRELTIEESDEDTFYFAPGFDTVALCYQLDDPDGVRPPARLELRQKGSAGPPLWSRELTAAEREPGQRKIAWKGELKDADPHLFPSGYVTLEASPYELRLVYPGSTAPSPDAWTHFEVRAAALEVALLPRKAVADTSTWDAVDAAGGMAAAGGTTTLYVGGNLFDASGRKYDEDPLYEAHRAAWGDGPTLPLIVTLKLQSCRDDMGAVFAPLGVGRTRFLWDYECVDPPGSGVSGYAEDQASGGKAAAFVERVGSFEEHATAPPGRNCPAQAGGKRGGSEGVLQVTPGYAPREESIPKKFPFRCERPSARTWAVVSHSWPWGTFAGQSGVVFQPSRMAGDAYRLRVYHVPDDAHLAALDIPGPLGGAGLHLTLGDVVIKRRVTIAAYWRKDWAVARLDWKQINRHFAPAYLEVWPTESQLMGPEEYEARIEVAREQLDIDERCALAEVDQHAAGSHAVHFRTHAEWKAAYAEALPGPIEHLAGFMDEEEYATFCYDLATKVIHLAWGDCATKAGLTVLQWNRSNQISTGLVGQAPSGLPSSRATRAVLLMFDDRDATKPGDERRPADTFVHEVGHHLFLPHAAPCSAHPSPDHHDPHDPLCMMSYDESPTVHFCGPCLLRLRGWKMAWARPQGLVGA